MRPYGYTHTYRLVPLKNPTWFQRLMGTERVIVAVYYNGKFVIEG